MPETPRRHRRKGLSLKPSWRDAEEEEEEDEENEEDDDDEFLPSEGSENEMETELLDYM